MLVLFAKQTLCACLKLVHAEVETRGSELLARDAHNFPFGKELTFCKAEVRPILLLNHECGSQ